jgi:hypothetical protein
MPEPAHSAAATPSQVWWRTFPDGHVGPVDLRPEPRPGELAFQPGASLDSPEPLDLPGIVDLRDVPAQQQTGANSMTSSPQTSDAQPPTPQPPLPTVNPPQASSLIAALVRSAPANDGARAPGPDSSPPVNPEVPDAYRYPQSYSQPQAYQPQQQAYQPQQQAYQPQPQAYPTGYAQDQAAPVQGYPSPQPQTYPSGYPADAPTAAWNGYEPAFDRSARTTFTQPQTAVHSSWRAALAEATHDLPRGTVRLIVGALVALVVVGTAVFFVLNRATKATLTTQPSTSKSASAGASGGVGTPLAAASIKATASSTGARDGAVTYVAANTLDGKPTTAWNSSGGGTGITLTFTFAQPVHLSGLTMLDGYQKTSKAGDLWALNARAKTVTVDSDAGSWTWDLTDTKDLQTLSQDLGTTSKVTLTIDEIYPGDKYADIAISELGFLAAR